MGIEIKSNFNPKQVAQRILENAETKLGRALEESAREIVQRTSGGKDVSGGSFAPYSPKYAAYKQKRGRRTSVDLTFTGAMLRSIQTKIQRLSDGLLGTIYFVSPGEATKARANMERRKFFGLSQQQIAALKDKLRNLYE